MVCFFWETFRIFYLLKFKLNHKVNFSEIEACLMFGASGHYILQDDNFVGFQEVKNGLYSRENV